MTVNLEFIFKKAVANEDAPLVLEILERAYNFDYELFEYLRAEAAPFLTAHKTHREDLAITGAYPTN